MSDIDTSARHAADHREPVAAGATFLTRDFDFASTPIFAALVEERGLRILGH